MIYYVTTKNKIIDTNVFSDIIYIEDVNGLSMFRYVFRNKKILAIDLETSGLDAYKNHILLTGIGTKQHQFIFDSSIDIKPYIEWILSKDITFLGHNLKFDIKFIKTNTNYILSKIYDTMIAEQRIYMRSGYRFGLDEVIKRYLGITVLKSTRNDFIDKDPNVFNAEPQHLYYLRNDLKHLFDIRKNQQRLIHKFKLDFLIYGIEFPLISIIAKAELEGFDFNVDLWRKGIIENKEEKFNILCSLDNELRELITKINITTKAGFTTKQLLSPLLARERIKSVEEDFFIDNTKVNQENLFGEQMTVGQFTGLKKKVKLNTAYIDYLSKKEVIYIFGALGEPLITPDETMIVPTFDNKGKIIQTVNTFSLNKDLLNRYLVLKPNTPLKTFINLLIKLSQIDKALNTYGENFINKINPITGKIHTIFRQCDADTGRFQSGGGTKEQDKPNFQNIPRDNKYRNCFTVDTEKYELFTGDYSGAELCVMASFAQDFRLIELNEGDMHSHMATVCWKNIFKFRLNKLRNLIKKDANLEIPLREEVEELKDKIENFVVTKETGNFRTLHKPLTFGTVYGMYPKKAGKALNVPSEEGRVVIDSIKKEIPATFKMVEEASNFAEHYGFIILNPRTNSRAWFPALIKQLRKEINKDTHFIEISEELSAARNIKIQGTQADFVKEASVVLDKYFTKNNLDCLILSWVHDELVIKINKELKDVPNPYIKGETLNIGEAIELIMITVANKYLHNVKIHVDYKIKDYWFK